MSVSKNPPNLKQVLPRRLFRKQFFWCDSAWITEENGRKRKRPTEAHVAAHVAAHVVGHVVAHVVAHAVVHVVAHVKASTNRKRNRSITEA